MPRVWNEDAGDGDADDDRRVDDVDVDDASAGDDVRHQYVAFRL